VVSNTSATLKINNGGIYCPLLTVARQRIRHQDPDSTQEAKSPLPKIQRRNSYRTKDNRINRRHVLIQTAAEVAARRPALMTVRGGRSYALLPLVAPQPTQCSDDERLAQTGQVPRVRQMRGGRRRHG